MHKTRRLGILSVFFFITLAAVLAASFSLKNSMDTRSRADFYTTGDCVDDPASFDYCGETAPFRGCVGGVGGNEWLCMCRLPSGKWWSECSVIESSEEKQKYITQCAGDKEKAFTQWKYDVALAETGGKCSCGGQNVCGSLIPTRPPAGGGGGGNFPPDEGPPPPPYTSPVIPSVIPSPTLTYRVGSGPVVPTSIYVPPRGIPIYTLPTGSIPTAPTAVPTGKPIINIDIKKNVEELMNFVAKTQKSLSDFFSRVLP